MKKFLILVVLMIATSFSFFTEKSAEIKTAEKFEITCDVTPEEEFIVVRSRGRTDYIQARMIVKAIQKYSSECPWLSWERVYCMCAIESDFIIDAVSCCGIKAGFGIAQLSSHETSALVEYNRTHYTNYTAKDLTNIDLSVRIAVWLLDHYHFSNINGELVERDLVATFMTYNQGYAWKYNMQDTRYYQKIDNLYNRLFVEV